MLDSEIRKKVISKGKPQPSDIPWYGEPNLGSIYGEDEIKAVVEVLRKSSHWSVGFGTNPEEIDAFENAFAAYCGANYAIAVSNNGVGFDMVLKAMEIEPGDEIIFKQSFFCSAKMCAFSSAYSSLALRIFLPSCTFLLIALLRLKFYFL